MKTLGWTSRRAWAALLAATVGASMVWVGALGNASALSGWAGSAYRPATVSLDKVSTAFDPSSATASVPNATPELAVAWVSADGLSGNQSVTVSDPAGTMSWTLAGRSDAQQGDAEVWWARTAGRAFSVRATQTKQGTNVMVAVTTYAGATGIGQVASGAAPGGAPSLTVTPQSSGSLVGAVGFDWDSATPRSLAPGQALDAGTTDPAGDTYWVQHATTPTTAGAPVAVADTAPTGDRWDMEAVEVLGGGGGGGTTTTTTAPPSGPVLDAATPKMAPVPNNVTTVTSPAFSPPAHSVLYASFAIDSPYIGEPGQTYVPHPHVASITNTGSPLVWHFLAADSTNTAYVGGWAEVWWASEPSSQSGMQVTATFAQASKNVTPPTGGFQILVVDGAAADQSAAPATATDSMAGTGSASASVSAPASALVLATVDTWNSVDNPPHPPAGQAVIGLVVNQSDVDSYWTEGLLAPTTAAGPVTMSAKLSRTDEWHEVAWAVLPG